MKRSLYAGMVPMNPHPRAKIGAHDGEGEKESPFWTNMLLGAIVFICMAIAGGMVVFLVRIENVLVQMEAHLADVKGHTHTMAKQGVTIDSGSLAGINALHDSIGGLPESLNAILTQHPQSHPNTSSVTTEMVVMQSGEQKQLKLQDLLHEMYKQNELAPVWSHLATTFFASGQRLTDNYTKAKAVASDWYDRMDTLLDLAAQKRDSTLVHATPPACDLHPNAKPLTNRMVNRLTLGLVAENADKLIASLMPPTQGVTGDSIQATSHYGVQIYLDAITASNTLTVAGGPPTQIQDLFCTASWQAFSKHHARFMVHLGGVVAKHVNINVTEFVETLNTGYTSLKTSTQSCSWSSFHNAIDDACSGANTTSVKANCRKMVATIYQLVDAALSLANDDITGIARAVEGASTNPSRGSISMGSKVLRLASGEEFEEYDTEPANVRPYYELTSEVRAFGADVDEVMTNSVETGGSLSNLRTCLKANVQAIIAAFEYPSWTVAHARTAWSETMDGKMCHDETQCASLETIAAMYNLSQIEANDASAYQRNASVGR